MTLIMAAPEWRELPCSRRQLRLDIVLQCGQSFRWRENKAGEWLGVLSERVWHLKQDETHLYYQVYNKEAPRAQSKTETESLPEEEDTKHHTTGAQRSQEQCSKPRSKPSTHEPQPRAGGLSPLKDVKVKTEKVDHSYESSPDSMTEEAPEDVKVPYIKPELSHTDAFLSDYFRLDEDVGALYQEWSAADEHFRKTVKDFEGVRMLRQDPVENLFSIICSTNNRITRTSSMVEKMCLEYGEPVAEVDGELHHSFPAIATLAQPGVREKLQELGFGYRAKYIEESAKYIMEKGGEEWVSSLRNRPYEKAKEELMKLLGVGPKVADCVCLMSLDKAEAVPVDTHVKQIAAEHYLPKLVRVKSVTDNVYQEIGDYFRKLWGCHAGWAQSVLFAAELQHMQSKKTSPAKTSHCEGHAEIKKKSQCAAGDGVSAVKHKRTAR